MPRLPWLGYPTEILDSDLSPTERLVLIVLWSYADRDGTRCFPKVARIAHDSGLARSSVQRIIARLERKGLVKRQPNQGGSNTYELNRVTVGPQYEAPDAPQSGTPPDLVAPGPEVVAPGPHGGALLQDANYGEPKTGTPPSPPRGARPAPRNGVRSSETILKSWNALAEIHRLTPLRRVSDTRRRKLNSRLKEHPRFWEDLAEELPRLGTFARDRRFVTFDFCLQASSLDKLLEGQYRDKEETVPANGYRERKYYNPKTGDFDGDGR